MTPAMSSRPMTFSVSLLLHRYILTDVGSARRLFLSRCMYSSTSLHRKHMPNRRQRSKPAAQHIAQFFALYPEIDYDPQASVSAEFQRLVATHRSKRRDEAWEDEAWERFSKAMGQQFSTFYGSDINDLRAWQALCIALRVKSVPDTVKECKKIIKSKHVNLVDFIDTRTTGKPIQEFGTEEELRDYTKEWQKYFPLESAKESGVLRYLLRHVL